MTGLNRAQRFEAAADHIEKYGHMKGRYHAGHTAPDTQEPQASCLVGALCWGGYGASVYNLDKAAKMLAWNDAHALDLPEGAPGFNDAEDTTAEDVVDLLRCAAKAEWEKQA